MRRQLLLGVAHRRGHDEVARFRFVQKERRGLGAHRLHHQLKRALESAAAQGDVVDADVGQEAQVALERLLILEQLLVEDARHLRRDQHQLRAQPRHVGRRRRVGGDLFFDHVEHEAAERRKLGQDLVEVEAAAQPARQVMLDERELLGGEPAAVAMTIAGLRRLPEQRQERRNGAGDLALAQLARRGRTLRCRHPVVHDRRAMPCDDFAKGPHHATSHHPCPRCMPPKRGQSFSYSAALRFTEDSRARALRWRRIMGILNC